MSFHFKNQNDLSDGTFRYFLSELDGLFYKEFKVFGQSL